MPKPRILPDSLLRALALEFGTPLYVQSADPVRARIAELRPWFDVVRYAMKANSCLALLEVVRGAGAHVDCVSVGEIARGLAAGWEPAEMCFTADLFGRRTLEAVARTGVPVNLGSLDMLEQYAEAARGGRGVTLRLNPGFGHGHSKKVETGGDDTKHGIRIEELDEAVRRARAVGLAVTGLHMHIGSGSDLEHLRRIKDAMVRAVRAVGDSVETVSPGGGLPIPYRADAEPFDVEPLGALWAEARDEIERITGRRPRVEIEPGRFLVAEGGLLLTEVRAVKEMGGWPAALVDAGFNDICRPMIYGAFHQVSTVGRDAEPAAPTVVAGPLCESSDVLTQTAGGALDPQPLPAPRVGDILCVHDTGAYGASMASNYNSMPIAPEVLVDGDEARLVRARQSIEGLIDAERETLRRESDASERPRFTHAGGIVLRDAPGGATEVLVVRSSSWTGERDEWVLPKGHIDPGEGATEAALREVREESGARGHAARYVGHVAYHAKGADVVCAFFAMELESLGAAEEPRGRAWLTAEVLRGKMPFSETLRLVERAIDAR